MPFDEKVKEKAEFIRIYGDKEEQERLGIHSVEEIATYAGISHNLGYKLKRKGQAVEDGDELEKFLKDVRERAKVSPGFARLFSQIKGYTGKASEEAENGLTPSEYIGIARDTRDLLREELKDTGMCPICCQRVPLHEDPRVDTEREQVPSGEMATVGLPD